MSKKRRKQREVAKPAPKLVQKPRYNLGKDTMARYLAHVAWVLTVLAGILFSLKTFKEPDLWWMFRTGEWILQNGHAPYTDPFSYTLYGSNWINVKWGFEVLITLFQYMGGPEFVYILQAIVTTAILLLVFRSYRYINRFLLDRTDVFPRAGLIIAVLAGLIATEFRINGRPEMVSHFFVVLYAGFMLAYRFQPSKQIFWLVLFQLIWVNFHEAYGIGIIMLTAFTAACWVDVLLLKRFIPGYNPSKPLWLTYTSLLAIPVMAINFYGPMMIVHPFNIFGQLGDNQYTTELVSFTHPNYWHYQSNLNLVFAAISLLGLFLKTPALQKTHKWFHRPFINCGTGYLLFMAMFFYLSLTAYRNIPFFILVSLPWVSFIIDRVISMFEEKFPNLSTRGVSRATYGLLTIAGIIMYIGIASGKYYETWRPDVAYGMQVDAVQNPVEVADFIERHNIEGRCFSDYLTSSYLMWRFRPDFLTFIDLRDLDVFPMEFFNRFAQIVHIPQVFDQADSLYQFDYVVLYRSEFSALHKHLFQRPDYIPVFADPVAVLYIKNKTVDQDFIEKYGYNGGLNDIFHVTRAIPPSLPARVVNHLFWPFYQPLTYEDVNFDALASIYYQSVGANQLALLRVEKAVASGKGKGSGFYAMGNYLLQYAQQLEDFAQREKYSEAFTYFERSYMADPSNAYALLYMGIISRYFGNVHRAEEYLLLSLNLNPGVADTYIHLAAIYLQRAEQDQRSYREHLRKKAGYLAKAYRISPDNIQVKLSLAITYCRVDHCRKARPLLNDLHQIEHRLDQQSRNLLRECMNKCL